MRNGLPPCCRSDRSGRKLPPPRPALGARARSYAPRPAVPAQPRYTLPDELAAELAGEPWSDGSTGPVPGQHA